MEHPRSPLVEARGDLARKVREWALEQVILLPHRLARALLIAEGQRKVAPF